MQLRYFSVAYELSESTVSGTITRIEGILFKCKEFSLPGKETLAGASQQYSVIVIDATESPIERPKKTLVLLRQKEGTHAKNTIGSRQKN